MSCPRCMGSPGLCPECEAYLFGDSDPKKAMTQQEALEEARRRWGWAARASVLEDGSYFVRSHRWTFKGYGDTYEEAFADADRRAASQKGESQ